MVKYNETWEFNFSNLLNLHYLDSDNIQKIAPKNIFGHFLFTAYLHLFLVPYQHHTSEQSTHPCDPDGSQDNAKWNEIIDRYYHTLHEAEGRYGTPWASRTFIFKTDSSNWSMLHGTRRDERRNALPVPGLLLYPLRIQNCSCSVNSIRDPLKHMASCTWEWQQS